MTVVIERPVDTESGPPRRSAASLLAAALCGALVASMLFIAARLSDTPEDPIAARDLCAKGESDAACFDILLLKWRHQVEEQAMVRRRVTGVDIDNAQLVVVERIAGRDNSYRRLTDGEVAETAGWQFAMRIGTERRELWACPKPGSVSFTNRDC